MNRDYKISWDTIENSLIDIERIVKKTGKVEIIAKHFAVSTVTFKSYRNLYPQLEQVIQKAVKFYRTNLDKRFNKKQLEEVRYTAEKTGELKEIAKVLNVHRETLRVYRAKSSKLDTYVREGLEKYRLVLTIEQLEILKNLSKKGSLSAIAKYLNKTIPFLYKQAQVNPILKDIIIQTEYYKIDQIFNQEKLKETERIIQNGYQKDAANYLNLKLNTLRAYRKKHPKLNQAIENGVKKQNKIYLYNPQKKLNLDVIEYNLEIMKKIIEDTGTIKAAAKYFKITPDNFRKYRKNIPRLEEEIMKSLNKFKATGKHIFNQEDLIKIEEILKTGFRKDVAVYLGTSTHSFSKYIKKYPLFAESIKKGEASREKDFLKKYKGKKINQDELVLKQKTPTSSIITTLGKSKRSQRELISKIDVLDPEDALARYRIIKAMEKEDNLLKDVKNLKEII